MAEEQKHLLRQLVEDYLDKDDHVSLKSALEEKRSSDISEIIEILENEERRIVFDILDKSVSAEVLEKVDEATRAELFEILEDKELRELISELNPDDAADVLSELPVHESQEVLGHMPEAHAHQIKGLMSYSEDSAGGIMDPILVSVVETATVGEAIREIQNAEIDEDFFSVYVVNSSGQLLGDVRIRDLLRKPEDTLIKQLIETDTIRVRVYTDQEEVRNIFSKNDLIVMAVIDESGALVGRITADRVIEVAEEEAAEDIYTMAGTDAAELENISIIHAARVRMTWLLPCLAGTAVTAIVYLLFKNLFVDIHLLPVYMTAIAFGPMIAAISGNAGLQTSAIVISGLATGDLATTRLNEVFAREVRVALFVAICCGLIGGMICGFLPNLLGLDAVNESAVSAVSPVTITEHIKIVAAFAVAMFSAIMVATTLGLFLPFLFRRVNIDPAISAGPLVTTANDSISVMIYLTLVFVLA
jgi:magnesium transporter